MYTEVELEGVMAPLAQATTLPPSSYTDAEVFRLEQRKIFSREWVCVARESQIPNVGDFLTAEVADQPLVVVRKPDGAIHAMSSVCLHRAMPICEGQGNTTSFSCPYHRWKYSLDGRLISAPLMEDVSDFDAGQCQLPAISVEIWQGFVMVNLSPDAASFGGRLARLDKMLENYGLGELAIASTTEFDSHFNWKLLIENFMEAYHHIGAHKDTLQPRYPAKNSYVVASENHDWSILHMPGVSLMDDHDQVEELPFFPGVNETQRQHLVAVAVSPTLIFAASGRSVFWYEISPVSHDRMTLRIHVLIRPETIADPQFATEVDSTSEIARFIHIEDIVVNEGPFRGLHSPLHKAGRLSLLEESIWHLNQFWAERILAA